jgi:glycerophosphoryl diester phosphodiesterase
VDGERENTLGSFRAAVAAGLGWVEVDARATADGVLVASHEPLTDDGRFVAALTAAEADAAGLLRVADLLDDLPEEVAVDVDVKPSLEDALRPRGRTTAALVAELLAGRGRRLLVTSFDAASLAIVRERAPGIPVGLLAWTRFPARDAVAAAAHLGVEVVGPHVDGFEADPAPVIAVAHDAGLEVLAWCPEPPLARRLADAGVDAVVVDDVRAGVAA